MKTYLLGLIYSLTFIVSYAQAQSPSSTRFWVSPGIGKATYPSMMIAMAIEPANTKTILSGRFSVNGEWIMHDTPGIRTAEWGLLYGRRLNNILVSAGVSYLSGAARGNYLYTDPNPYLGTGKVYEKINYKTIGIPMEVRYIAALKHVGIGLTAFGNVNTKRSFIGLNVSLYAGKMK
ncbi:hypothetical protein F5984_02340 [Rudanella paleaurantiibacter]|uniref:Outer membrane beta-barrel protein n=1 Tax=Rudanella paleaurantiibacter TaxID=2614655 RepID=A0A7J5U6N0_9BACT|nr:hypothetical protein [Rudanella paleaurantiibacter]KAB7732810.1 hypothetical protein F5984_02340 [Rudanella paleaurantiibacter]